MLETQCSGPWTFRSQVDWVSERSGSQPLRLLASSQTSLPWAFAVCFRFWITFVKHKELAPQPPPPPSNDPDECDQQQTATDRGAHFAGTRRADGPAGCWRSAHHRNSDGLLEAGGRRNELIWTLDPSVFTALAASHREGFQWKPSCTRYAKLFPADRFVASLAVCSTNDALRLCMRRDPPPPPPTTREDPSV